MLLEISDNGIGMVPDTAMRVFELFSQAERTPDRSQGGLGMELFIVQSLVESHCGSVHAMSDGLGKSRVFTICIPCTQHDVRTTESQKVRLAETDTVGTRVRVIIVDDNVDVANTLGMLLEAIGFDTSVQYTASSAIEAARHFAPQVCLLDIGLSDIDGIELARRLRKMPETEAAVLIAATGYGQESDRKQVLAAGFDHHLVKPLDTKKLVSILAEVGRS